MPQTPGAEAEEVLELSEVMDVRGSILQGEPLELLSRSCCRLLQFAAEGEVVGGGGKNVAPNQPLQGSRFG